MAELEKPDVELRKNILRNKIRRDGLNIPETVINYIAENVNESVRELEGIINSLLHNPLSSSVMSIWIWLKELYEKLYAVVKASLSQWKISYRKYATITR